jgi:hypothetical protein
VHRLAARSLHVERFSPKAVAAPVRREAFEVVLERSGVTLTVPPERSILSVVEDAGIGAVSASRFAQTSKT